MLTPSYSYTYTYSYANVLTVTDPKHAYIGTTSFAPSRVTPHQAPSRASSVRDGTQMNEDNEDEKDDDDDSMPDLEQTTPAEDDAPL